MGCIPYRTEHKIDKVHANRWMYGWTNRWTDGGMDGGVDRQMHEQADR